MFKVGQMVKYLGIKSNIHGDTHKAEELGYLTPGKNYKIANVFNGESKLVTLWVDDPKGYVGRTWTLGKECVLSEPRYKKNLPNWF